jgi:hypothetical protein
VSKACVKIVQFTSSEILSQATIVLFTINCICSLTGTTFATSTVGDSVFVIFSFQRLNGVPAVTASIEIEFDVFVIFKTHEFDEAIREAKADIVKSFVPEKVTEYGFPLTIAEIVSPATSVFGKVKFDACFTATLFAVKLAEAKLDEIYKAGLAKAIQGLVDFTLIVLSAGL